MIKLRASRMPLFLACPASLNDADCVKIEGDPSAANLGTAVHEIMADIVDHQYDAVPDVSLVAAQYGVNDVDELERLSAYGLRAWRELKEFAPVPVTEGHWEVGTEHFELSGHTDVLSISCNRAVIIDWKTGWLQSDASDQMAAYAYLVASGNLDVQEFTAFVVRHRYSYYDVFRCTRDQLYSWKIRVDEALGNTDTFRPDAHCRFCYRRFNCPAQTAMVRRAVAALGDNEIPMSIALYRRAQAVKHLVDDYVSVVKTHILTHGPIEDGGYRLDVLTELHDKIDPLAAWPHMIAAGLSDEQIARAVRLSKGALLDAVGELAPPRGKSKAKAEFMERLNDAGCVRKDEVLKFKETRL